MKTLVIDDEAPIRLLCRVNLEAEGVEVLEAADGRDRARDREAGETRRDFARRDDARARRVERRRAPALRRGDRAIPIIFLTARADLRDRVRGMDAGGLDYMTKPFNPVELASLVRDVVDAVARGEREQLRKERIAELRSLFETA